jgi:hypothetical protein
MRWRISGIVGARDTPLSYGPFYDTVNWLWERHIGMSDRTAPGQSGAQPPDGEGIGDTGTVPELEPSSPAEGASHNGAERSAVPYRHAGGEGKQRAEVEGEENETAAARPRHYQTNGRARRLEPDAERFHGTAHRDQAGKREGGWDGQNTPGHDPP